MRARLEALFEFEIPALFVTKGQAVPDVLVELARQVCPAPPAREMDMLLSTGERITMSLLCMALHQMGVDSVSLTGSQCGIITNHRHNDAQVIEVRPFRVQDESAPQQEDQPILCKATLAQRELE